LARRYASSFTLGSNPDTFGASPLLDSGTPTFATAAGSAVYQDQGGRLYIAPSCYSGVRKVVFWCAFRHEQTGGGINIPCRLRVAPSSSSQSTRSLESKIITPGVYNVTGGTGSIWTINTIINEACLYGAQGSRQNSVQSIGFPTLDTSGSQVVFQEFDRFQAGDVDFFGDWDATAAFGNDDRHLAYALAVERTDSVAWANSGTANANLRPVMVAMGFAVIQAPSTVNNTRIIIPATCGLNATGAIQTSFSIPRVLPFFFHAAEWDGDIEIRYVSRMRRTGAGNIGSYSIQVSKIVGQSTTETPIFSQSFVKVAGNHQTCICRSSDIRSLIADGDVLIVMQKSDTGVLQPIPYGWWEITQKAFNRTTVFFHCGHSPLLATTMPGTIPSGTGHTYDKNAGLFDPLWFQDMEQERFISSRIQGGLDHVLGNDTAQQVNINANLGDDVSISLFNVIMAPEISSTPNATVGWKLRDGEITSSNPLNLAGKRKLTERFDGSLWISGTDDIPGGMGLAFAIDVPNTDILELGPLFDLGAFDPEGCAATSAGLGEPPLLIITNGSTLPQKFNPAAAGTPAEIEDAGVPTPFEGEVPQAVPDDSVQSPDGGLELGAYRYRYTFRNCCTGKESDPNVEDIVVDTTGQSPAALVTLSFAGVRIPSDPQLCEICLYRTVEGGDFPIMAKVGCFNIDETSTFVDDKSDSALDFLNDGLSILNGPMPCVSIVVDFRNRLFGMGDIPNLAPAGLVSVVNGSDVVHGNGDVNWDRCLEGKFIQIGEDCRSYEILRIMPPDIGVSPPIARLKLTDPYEGSTDTGLTYHICGRPNRLYFSEPLEPEYWPAANFLDVEPGDGDRLMGAVSNFDRLVICKRRKTYVLTFSVNPGQEVVVPSRISSDIGCVGPRTFAQIESGSVWLSERGIALYDGRTVQHVPESFYMNSLFVDPDNPNYIRRDRNGRVIEAVAVFYPKREQYLLLLPTVKTNRGCSLMVVWDVKLQNITVLQFCQQFLSMVVGKDSEGNERVYIGDVNGFVWIYDIGGTDGVGFPNSTGTIRGTVTFAGIETETGASVLDDDIASFITGGIPSFANLSGVDGFSSSLGGGNVGLAGVCIYVRRKDAAYGDPWLVRTIYAATTTRLYITPQWGPDTPFDDSGTIEYEYMLGAIEFDLLFKPQNYGTDDMPKRTWRQIVVHEVEAFASQLRIDLLPDFQLTDPEAETVVDPVTQEVGEGRVFRMDYSKGRQVKPVGRNIHMFMAVRMRNFAPDEPIRIINHVLGENPITSK